MRNNIKAVRLKYRRKGLEQDVAQEVGLAVEAVASILRMPAPMKVVYGIERSLGVDPELREYFRRAFLSKVRGDMMEFRASMRRGDYLRARAVLEDLLSAFTSIPYVSGLQQFCINAEAAVIKLERSQR